MAHPIPDTYPTGSRVPSPRPTIALRPYPSPPSPLCPKYRPSSRQHRPSIADAMSGLCGGSGHGAVAHRSL
ncbi:hypothetical protein K503DRAFT_798121 [Rhizopogon vinicolor AM-OR11-026]|uniref:Uncharacterized protein n=1 Tax=Rhizopogon vinicolor AM-OR11-026 TaxID=1314800 RepID=A0A1B7N8X0_9AGAM|nr:hypothetical protein K503DRAFT_798121 [Rhizopogon vinicolor AM-OR11-026]